MNVLKGKVSIVTGASSGIGRAVAEELATLGAKVVIQARRKERLDELAKSIAARGSEALVVRGDAGKEADIDQLLKEALAWGGGKLDVVIVNAGRGLAGGLLSSDQKQWQEMYQTNVMGAALLMRKAGEVMLKQKSGDILVLGSVAGHNISPFSGFYGSSKWALWSMAEAFRREVCVHGIRVTTVMPAIVVSEFQQVAGYTQENFGKNAEHYGKLLAPADVARTIGFIVSQPPHVHINELVIRPTGQDYP